MKELVVSKRIARLVDYIPSGAYLADIGSDHAYLPCYAAMKGHIVGAIAGEINEGPYRSAQETVKQYKLEKVIEVRRGNGLNVITSDDQVDAVVIAGMGGELIRTILEEGKHKLNPRMTLILQPNVGEKRLREWLEQEQWWITDEEILEEEGHIYEVLIAKRHAFTPARLSLEDLWFGPYLRQHSSAIFKKKWQAELQKRRRVLASLANAQNADEVKEKRKALEKEIALIEEVIT
ncbi:SAM-dependent methyltransferase [Pullulanibacillus camelliae]|uniref:SAM-dependent methyltransferase n=1 Tax=Pullulanibacillus camelliae TaxID=1707096 RepID=A0A8J2YJB6_9BACL|nr:SAM-dependent methyltransferase [Pullulanibacillus camelliae]